MTTRRGLAFRTEAAALNEHSLAVVLCRQRWLELQQRFSESRDLSLQHPASGEPPADTAGLGNTAGYRNAACKR
ncbi:MAG: hypothetical protein ACKO3T_08660, partial [Planctomycetaceae bacterium]